MFLSDVVIESHIFVTVYANEKSAQFESTVIKYENGGLVVNPFVHENTIINFNLPQIRIEMLVSQGDNPPNLWKSVHIQRIEKDGSFFHFITSEFPGVRLNRRKQYRLFIGEEGCLTIGQNSSVDVLVKDISAGGFAVIISKQKKLELPKHFKINLHYCDRSMNENLVISGRIVRKDESERQVLYGCLLDKEYTEVNHYISGKQAQRRLHSKVRVS